MFTTILAMIACEHIEKAKACMYGGIVDEVGTESTIETLDSTFTLWIHECFALSSS